MNIVFMNELNSNQIAMSTNLYNKLMKPKKINASFGQFKKAVDIVVKNDLISDEIGLPYNFSKLYSIPTDLQYDYYVKNKEIHIGPVIAFVVYGALKDLGNEAFYKALPRFLNYPEVRGLIFICTAKSIKVDKGVIEGYYFDPKEGPESKWKHGFFPLPDAVYNRSFMSQREIASIRNKIGDKLFNSYWHNLNKWKIWVNLSKDKTLRNHLPYTEVYSDVKQLERLLDVYNSLYLKPFKRSRGTGIMMVRKNGSGIQVVNNTMETWYFEDYMSLGTFLKRMFTDPNYIVQQAVPFAVDGRNVDFRVCLQKDHTKKWTYCGLMGRVLPKGGIISNRTGNPETTLGSKVLREFYNLDDEGINKLQTQITELIIKAINIYEKLGMHLVDVAADLVIDSNLHINILELQLNQGMYGTNEALTKEFYVRYFTNPFRYAKALAGFQK